MTRTHFVAVLGTVGATWCVAALVLNPGAATALAFIVGFWLAWRSPLETRRFVSAIVLVAVAMASLLLLDRASLVLRTISGAP